MKNYDRYSLALIATARLLCVDNFKMHNLDMNTKAAIHFENLSKFHKSNWVLCADGGMCKTQSTVGVLVCAQTSHPYRSRRPQGCLRKLCEFF